MSTGPLLAIQLDGPGPLGRRLEARLRHAVRGLDAGTKLPSTRALAADLRISRGVVVGAYEQLAAEGYLVLRRGAAPLVAPLPSRAPPLPVEEDVHVAGSRYNLRPDLPDLSLFPRADWLRALRAALARAADVDLAYGEPFGAAELRHRLAPFLARTRGIQSDPSRIGIHVGSTHALSVLARASGASRIAVEDPSHRWRRLTLAAAGVEVVPVRVDEQGLCVDEIPDEVDAVLVSPDHSFPTGAVLSPERRRALVARDVLIVEHDYDGHFRYDRPPASALQALAPDRVAYIGSASALLAPTLRLGWSVLPERLVIPVARAMAESVFAVPRLEQFALAELIDRGLLDRHLRRARAAYKRRREIVCAALPVLGAPVGLYVRVPVEDENRLLDALHAQHVALDGVQANALGDCEPALVIGFAASSEPTLRRAVQLLRRML